MLASELRRQRERLGVARLASFALWASIAATALTFERLGPGDRGSALFLTVPFWIGAVPVVALGWNRTLRVVEALVLLLVMGGVTGFFALVLVLISINFWIWLAVPFLSLLSALGAAAGSLICFEWDAVARRRRRRREARRSEAPVLAD